MSIRIEVTGDSLPEIADKLLALASQFSKQAVPFDPPAAPVEDKPKQTRKSKNPDKAPAAEAEQADVGNGVSNVEDASPTTNFDTKSNTAETATSPSETPTLDFDKDVAPVVIEAVQKAGRDGVSAILSEFGAERASEVDPAQWPELVERLKAL